MTEPTLPLADLRPASPAPRLGVVVCDCGHEIAGRLDTGALCAGAAALPGVVYAAREAYPCSPDGQARLRQAIAEHQVDRVLIAGCAPRLVEKLFRRASGLGEGGVEIADIREQCAYVHAGGDGAATRKAAELIEMGLARLSAAGRPRPQVGRVIPAALVLGGGLSALAAALALADEGIPVTLVEAGNALGLTPNLADERAREMIAERVEAATHHRRIRVLLNAHLADVAGSPGDYQVRVGRADGATAFAVGAILVAADSLPRQLGAGRWYDRARVKTQAEFERELDAAGQPGGALALREIVMILGAEQAADGRSASVTCLAAIRQAARARQINPEASVTLLFRELYLGGTGDRHADELQRARDLGVSFFRYPAARPPVVGQETVDVPDPLTGVPVRLPFDRVVLAMPFEPPAEAGRLAALLRVPQDADGFLVQPAVRLRPGRFAEDGVYVLGGAHQPVEATEALFQAYTVGARALRFLRQGAIRLETPTAQVDAALCTGCAQCAPACPAAAINLRPREPAESLSLAVVQPLRCTGCGNCLVACPVKAISLPGWDDAAILGQISAALRPRPGAPPRPRVVVLACEWSAYAAADLAGARRAPYPEEVYLVRLPCAARFDPNHALWAFLNGAAGVVVGACPPGECHHGPGDRCAAERVEGLRRQLAESGFDPGRLQVEFLPGDDGAAFARAVTNFVETTIRER